MSIKDSADRNSPQSHKHTSCSSSALCVCLFLLFWAATLFFSLLIILLLSSSSELWGKFNREEEHVMDHAMWHTHMRVQWVVTPTHTWVSLAEEWSVQQVYWAPKRRKPMWACRKHANSTQRGLRDSPPESCTMPQAGIEPRKLFWSGEKRPADAQ